jgi:undecaprenyl diphosphate synthase
MSEAADGTWRLSPLSAQHYASAHLYYHRRCCALSVYRANLAIARKIAQALAAESDRRDRPFLIRMKRAPSFAGRRQYAPNENGKHASAPANSASPAGLSKEEARRFAALDHHPDKMPRHIAIIMDGNGRWARKRHLPRFVGHRQGVQSVRKIVETAARIHLPWMTLYAFSAENWKRRPATEVDFLMALLKEYLKAEVPLLIENNVQLRYIGRLHELPGDVQQALEEARLATNGGTGLVLTLALNYGARDEIVDAARLLAEQVKSGKIAAAAITEEAIARHLYTREMPDPDLVIRSSGEMRISNFLLWQIAYSEIYVTEKLWPDFNGADLIESIAEYQKRERRYGGLGSDHAHPHTTATNDADTPAEDAGVIPATATH